MAEIVKNVLAEAHKQGRDESEAAPALAVDAARSWSERTSTPLPRLLEDSQEEEWADAALQTQRRWLAAADEADMRSYLPLLTYHLSARQSSELVSSPSLIEVAVIAALARLRSGTGPITILDNAVGAGAMAAGVSAGVARLGYTTRVLGQELSRSAALVGAATLFLQGSLTDVRVANSLTDDVFPDDVADLAVSQPPWGLSWNAHGSEIDLRHRADGWYPFGLPQRSDSTWLFASRLLEKLRPPEAGGGRAVVFAAPSALTGNGGDSIRRAVLTADLLETVIALPGGLAPSTVIPLYALVFANQKAPARAGKVQAVDLRPYFGASRDRWATPRDLRADAFDVLRQALGTARDGIASRTLPLEHFLRRRLTVSLAVAPKGDATTTRALSWPVNIPENRSPDDFLAERYAGQETGRLTWQPEPALLASLEIDSVFDETRSRLEKWIQKQHWTGTRLSALLSAAPRVVSPADAAKAAAESHSAEASENRPMVMLPTGDELAFTSAEPYSAKGRVLAIELSPGTVSPEFVVSWLNSALGKESRRRALTYAASGVHINAVRSDERSLLRLTDELIISMPPSGVQESLSATEARLTAVASLAERARRELWSAPGRAKQLASQFDSLFDDSLGAWANDLPYPIASAVWTLETRNTVDARHKQMFLVWEAYAAFFGTVLLSALGQDPVLRDSELPALRAALSNASVSMDRASFGTWNVIAQRLSARFRDLLAKDDPDERARVTQIFGSPSYDTLSQLLSPSVIRLLNDANAKRNQWLGHGGASSETELQTHVDYLAARLGELRDHVGSAWRELQCVRAGDGWRRSGQTHQKVEVAMGPSTPFRQTQLRVGELMERDDLYLATDGCAQPLRLQHLFVLRPSPNNARYACYFYNRIQGDKVRIVSYHLADDSDLTETFTDVAAAAHDLLA